MFVFDIEDMNNVRKNIESDLHTSIRGVIDKYKESLRGYSVSSVEVDFHKIQYVAIRPSFELTKVSVELCKTEVNPTTYSPKMTTISNFGKTIEIAH